MPKALIDISAMEFGEDVLTEEDVRKNIPHAHEFQMIDGICHLDLEEGVVVGYKDWDENPWWAKGHIPGRPLMPGVLMAEGAAQVATILMKKFNDWPTDRFIGLAGLDKVRFRGQVVPPARVYFVSRIGTVSGGRLAKYPAQCYCDGKMIMDMELLGTLL